MQMPKTKKGGKASWDKIETDKVERTAHGETRKVTKDERMVTWTPIWVEDKTQVMDRTKVHLVVTIPTQWKNSVGRTWENI
jgi:hypothetical protein